MAILRQGILGGISGKIGSIVGARIFGKDTIRTRPSSRPASSDLQIKAQIKFKMIMFFCKQILISIINHYSDNRFLGMSNINRFIQRNYNYFDDNGRPTAQIIMTTEIGQVDQPLYDAILYNPTTGVITIMMQDWEEPGAQPDDILDVLIFQKSTSLQVDYIPYFMLRQQSTYQATIPTGLDKDDLIVWSWYRRGEPSDSGFQISNSWGTDIY